MPITAADPSTARLQRTRLRWVTFGGLSYALDTLWLALFAALGATSWQIVAGYGGISLLATAGFLLLVASGRNLRWRQPDPTASPLVIAAGLQLGFLLLAPEVGFVFVLTLFVVAAFGILTLSTRQFIAGWLGGGVALGLVFALTAEHFALPVATGAQQAVGWLCVMSAIGRCIALSIGMQRLRDKLYRQKQALQASHRKIERLATVDELTQVWNRRALMAQLDAAVRATDTDRRPFCIAILDLDNFKQVNDRHGHLVGDAVLKRFAGTLADRLRPDDRLGRFGGEEFIVMLSDSDRDGACRVVERLRETVSAVEWETLAAGLAITVSVGIAQHRPGESVASLTSRADTALYEAKHGGRNRVCVAA